MPSTPPPKSPGLLIPKIVLLVLLAALLGLYYWAHRPIIPEQAVALFQLARDLLPMLLIAATAGGIGRHLLRPLDLAVLHRAERVALEALIGLGAISLGALVAGLAGAYKRETLWLVLGGAVLVSRPSVVAWARDILTLCSQALHLYAIPPFVRFIKITTGALLLLALLMALAPPVAWDAQTYHLTAPKTYLAAGTIRAHPENFFLGLPENAEMVYGVAISAFDSFNAAAPIHWLYGVFGLLAIGGLVRRYTRHETSPETAWIAVLLPLTGYSTWWLFGTAYVDLAVFAYAALALCALTIWRDTQNVRWLTLIGIITGFAFGTKYVAGAFAVALVAEMTISLWQRTSKTAKTLRKSLLKALLQAALQTALQTTLQTTLLFGIGFALVFVLWAVKGLVLYHNPLYPFVFGGLNWDADRAASFSGGTGLLVNGAWQLPVLPLAATVFGIEKTVIAGVGTFAFTVGLWLFTLPYVLSVLLFLYRFTNRFTNEAVRPLVEPTARIAGILLVYWIVIAGVSSIGIQTRLVVMAFPVAAILGGFAFAALRQLPPGSPDLGFIFRIAFIVTVSLNVLDAIHHTVTTGALDYALYGNATAYLERNLGTYNYAMRRIDELNATTLQVRFLWEPRSLYCPARVTCLPDVGLDLWRAALRDIPPHQILANWQASGDTHILVFDAGLQASSAENTQNATVATAFRNAASEFLTPIWSDGTNGYTLYVYK